MNSGDVLTADSKRHLQRLTRAGVESLNRQQGFHGLGFAQDVYANDGTLVHAELSRDGVWLLTDADTGEFLGALSDTEQC